MGMFTLLLSSIVAVLFYLCLNFTVIEESSDLFKAFENICKETNYLYVSWGSLCVIALHFGWNTIKEIGKKHRSFSKKISKAEYEYQKETYTQIKLNELMNSKGYQEYMKNKNGSKFEDRS